MIPLYHTVCGKPALLYRSRPGPRDAIFARHATALDGSAVVEGAQIVCGSCGAAVLPGTLVAAEVYA